MKKLFVNGLPYNLTSDELREAFGQAGEVISADVIMDRDTNRSRGYGFVEYATEEDAKKGIEMWHEKELGGRNINVMEARPREDNGPRRDNNGGGYRGGNNSGGFRRSNNGGGGNSFRMR